MKSIDSNWESKNVLITVKTYPNPSLSHKETVCVAGISDEGKWIRIYPIKFRNLPYDKRFKKYDVIKMKVRKEPRDPRPESYFPDSDSFELQSQLPSNDGWKKRREWVFKAGSHSMCDIQEMQKTDHKTLGTVHPKRVLDFLIEDDSAEWSPKLKEVLSQLELFEKRTSILEKIPLKFKYKYICSDPNCTGHEQSIFDWEIFALYRQLKKRHQQDIVKIKSDIKKRFFEIMCNEKRDVCFFVGNQHWFPKSFIILGVFWPPKLT
ncbi:MAG: hypothetical protein MUO31_09130 [Thermodesulfovibrionales bacterium]|nr:hypothetical protein [Thermodesulfovibrionales bacterium]